MKLWKKLVLITTIAVLAGTATAGITVIVQSFYAGREKLIESCEEQLSATAYAVGREIDRTFPEQSSPAAQRSYLNFLLGKFDASAYILLLDGEEVCNRTSFSLNLSKTEEWNSETAQSRIQEIEGEHYLVSGQKLPVQEKGNYSLVLVRNISMLYRENKRQAMFQIGVTGSCILVVMLVVSLIARKMLRPLGELEEAAGQIGEGKIPKSIAVKGKDEVAALAEAFGRMAGQIEEQMKELTDVSERRKLLLGSMAHEMKTPMTSIIGYADTLLHVRLEKEQQDRALRHIYEESTRLERLSEKLMSLLEVYDNESICMTDTDMEELFARVQSMEKAKLAQKGIVLKCCCEMEIQKLDADLFESLLINLVDNAIKASEAGKTIWMQAKDGMVTVTDQGYGIPAEEIERVKDAFYRVDKARSRKAGGNGIGLALCDRIARLHGAELRIESRVGEGTRVTVTWNREQEEETDE